MPIGSTSLAAGTGHSVKNVAITPAPTIKSRKIAILGAALAAKITAGLAVKVPVRVYSSEQVATLVGSGTQLHRLALNAFSTSNGVETYIVPLAEGGSDVVATGTITYVATTVKAGTLSLYINNDLVQVSVATGAVVATIASATASAINANAKLPVTAVAALGVVTITAKTKGTWGNDISVSFNLKGEPAVDGVTPTVVPMASGTGKPVISLAVMQEIFGDGDSANDLDITDLVHGNGTDTTTLDAIADYVGRGNTAIGLYAPTNGRFFRSINCSVLNDLNGEITASDLRKDDRANGVVVVPNTHAHPGEIASSVMGIMAAKNAVLAESGYIDEIIPGVIPGATRWTNNYDSRDLAVKSGISPTIVRNGTVVLQNIISYYRPDNVPEANNGYRSMRNISVLQNVEAHKRAVWNSEKWQNITIVKDAKRVTNPNAKVRDIQAVKNQILEFAYSWEKSAWIFSADSVREGLKDPNAVILRTGGTGFDSKMKIVLSGEGGIISDVTEFDINFGG